MHQWQLVICLASLLCLAAGGAHARGVEMSVEEQDTEHAVISPHSGYVPVPLGARANHETEGGFAARKVTVDGVPFKTLAEGDGANNVFLERIGWSGWAADSSSFYDPYDYDPEGAPHRWVTSLPKADYSAVHLLAYAEPDADLSNVISFRMGAIGGGQRNREMSQVVYHDFSATVPRVGEAAPGRIDRAGWPGEVYYVRVPLGAAIAQDLVGRQALDVDITKQLRLAVRRPDPNRFRVRPLGLPSGVHVFAMTFERSPIQMEVRSDEVGHIFNEPQTPTFHVSLKPRARLDGSGRLRVPDQCTIEAVAKDHYGNRTTVSREHIALNPTEAPEPVTVALPMSVPKRGHHELSVRLVHEGEVLLERRTTFALLPEDTREHRDESPFGVRENFAHFTPQAPEVRGELHAKAGLRYAFRADELEGYGVVEGRDPVVKSGEAVERLAERFREQPDEGYPPRLMIFHEDHLGKEHHRRPPDQLTGWGPYELSEQEQQRLDNMMDGADAASRAIEKHFPLSEIYFGNGSALLLEEFLRHEFPAERLGSRGSEPVGFARPPEAQPPDYNAVNAAMWIDRTLLDAYGYEDTPLRMAPEIAFPGTNPGNLQPRTQANYIVRHLMHMLAWRIPVIRPAWLADGGNSYYFGGWASSGLCYAQPEVNPKPAYVAYATTTLMLDGAELSRDVPTGSPVIYALEFEKKDGTFVTCLWTPRAQRTVRLAMHEASEGPVVTDLMANETAPATTGTGEYEIEVSPAPIFVSTDAPVGELTPEPAPRSEPPDEEERFLISALDSMSKWTIERGRNIELETYNYDRPRRAGDFTYREVAAPAGEGHVLEVSPNLPVEGSEHLPMYSVLAHTEGVEIPGEPTEIGLMVNGNGGWGRIIFELEDAEGQRWISLGGEQPGDSPPRWLANHLGDDAADMTSTHLSDANANDLWGQSYINFEGWRYLSFPLPGNYPGEGYHWPRSGQWRHDGDGVVAYPLRLKKIVVTMPERIVHLTRYERVEQPEIQLKDLSATYRPIEEAHGAR